MKIETLSTEALRLAVPKLNTKELLFQTQEMVTRERELTAKTLVFFQEIENRMLHLQMGFSSLFDMLVKYFKLSEGSASRRVASVRLIEQVPEVEEKIKDGSLTLSNVAAAQRFFKAEAKNNHAIPLQQKKEVLDSLVGKSARETERELQLRSSLPMALQVPDQIKPRGVEHVEIRFVATQQLADLLEEARGLLSHRIPGGTLAEVIQYLTELSIEKIKKERFGVGQNKEKCGTKPVANVHVDVTHKKPQTKGFAVIQKPIKQDVTRDSHQNDPVDIDAQVDLGMVQADVRLKPAASKRSRYIRVKIRRNVYERSQGRCEFVDPLTGKRCNSTSFLQNHHVTAFARGGEHSEEGLKLVCRAHNSYHAILDFSAEWMNQFKKVVDPLTSD